MKQEIIDDVRSLILDSPIVYVSSVNQEGFPNTKAMMNLKRDGIKTHYFSTNYATARIQQFMNNPKACIYFCKPGDFKGFMLVGTMEVMADRYHKELLWSDGCEIYYPKGVEDEDYAVLRFTAEWGNYYHGLQNSTYTVEELAEYIAL